MVSPEMPERKGRRFFLKAMGVLAFSLGLPSSVCAFFVKDFPVRTVEKKRFIFEPGKGMLEWEKGGKEPYSLLVDGLVEQPAAFSYEELRSFPQVEQTSDFHCVEGWSVKDLHWDGFRFAEIIKRVTPKPKARYAVFHSLGETGYTPKGQRHYLESFPVRELLDPAREIILALDRNGKPLSRDHGAPLRVVAPLDLGYKSIKFVHRIEFTRKARPGWWTLANPIYPIIARVPRDRLRKK